MDVTGKTFPVQRPWGWEPQEGQGDLGAYSQVNQGENAAGEAHDAIWGQ